MSSGLIVQFCVVGPAIFGVLSALLTALGLGVFVSDSFSILFRNPLLVCIREVLRHLVGRFGGIVLLVLYKPANDVLQSVGSIDVPDNTVNDILPQLFFFF